MIRKRQGLSLVELMAAIAIMGLIALAGIRLLSSAMETWRRETALMIEQKRLRDAADSLQADLQALTLQPGSDWPFLDFELSADPAIACAFHTFPWAEGAPVSVAYFVKPRESRGWDIWRIQADPVKSIELLPDHAAVEVARELLSADPDDLAKDERVELVAQGVRTLNIQQSPEGVVEFIITVLLPQGEEQLEGNLVPQRILNRYGIHEVRKVSIPTYGAAAL